MKKEEEIKSNASETTEETPIAPEKKTRMGKLKKKQAHLEANWGGVREGCGRKRDGAVPKVTLAFCLEPKAKELYNKLKERGVNPAKSLEAHIYTLAELFGIE